MITATKTAKSWRTTVSRKPRVQRSRMCAYCGSGLGHERGLWHARCVKADANVRATYGCDPEQERSRRVPIEPMLFPLSDARDHKGYRVAALRGAGNAICIGTAAAFIHATKGPT